MDPDAFVLVGTLATMIAGAAAAGTGELRARRAAWQAAADRVGGRYRPQGLFYVPPTHRLHATVDGIPVQVTLSALRTAPLSHQGVYTRVAAPVGDLAGVELCVACRPTPPLARLAFGHDVRLGDAALDRALEVVSLRPAQARAWLDEAALAALRGCPGWLLVVDGKQLVLAHGGFVTESDSLAAAMLALPVLARSVPRWWARWDEAAAAVGAVRLGPGRYERVRRGARDAIDVAADAGAARLTTELPRAAAGQAPRPTPDAAALEREGGVRRVVCAGDVVTVEIDAARPDAAALRAALARLEQLAPGGDASAYR